MIKKKDSVVIMVGADKGKKGSVLKVYPTKGMLLVEGINMKTKHQRARQSNKKGQIIKVAHPIHISNVRLGDAPKKKGKK
jgi:large subunit ribosomal protein L24